VPNWFDIAGQAMQKKGSEVYKVPETRAAGRPHELGWLDMLEDEDEQDMRFGKVPAGRIISE